jgi:hypothetical protein
MRTAIKRMNAKITIKLVFFNEINGPDAAQAGLDRSTTRQGVI